MNMSSSTLKRDSSIFGRGTTEYIDALIVVVEPGRRSFQTARQVKKLADDIGIRKVYIAGNKITGQRG